MVQYSNKAKSCIRSEKDGTILKQGQYLSTSRKKMVNTQTEQHVTSQKKMVQFSNCAKTCLQSEKYGSILSAESEKGDTILKQSQKLSQVRKRWYNTQTDKTCQQSEKDGTILKQCQNLLTVRKDGTILNQCQNLSPVRKRW